MPLAGVIYVVSFDHDGVPCVQGRIHTDTAGRAHFAGDAARAFVMLEAALEVTGRRFSTRLTEQITQAMEEKRLLNAELSAPGEHALPFVNPEPPPELPAAGDCY